MTSRSSLAIPVRPAITAHPLAVGGAHRPPTFVLAFEAPRGSAKP